MEYRIQCQRILATPLPLVVFNGFLIYLKISQLHIHSNYTVERLYLTYMLGYSAVLAVGGLGGIYRALLSVYVTIKSQNNKQTSWD